MQTIITNKNDIMLVLSSLHEIEHRWLIEADAQFTVTKTWQSDYLCSASRSEYNVNTNSGLAITFEDDNIALQFKLTYGDLL